MKRLGLLFFSIALACAAPFTGESAALEDSSADDRFDLVLKGRPIVDIDGDYQFELDVVFDAEVACGWGDGGFSCRAP